MGFVKILCDIADLQLGYQSGAKIRPVEDGAWRIIQASDVTPDLEISTESMLRFEPTRDPERYLVQPGDVLFLARGPRTVALCPSDVPTCAVASNSFFILRSRGDVLPKYLAWWINQSTAQAYIGDIVTGATMPYVRRAEFERLPVDVPSQDTQRLVVDLDAARAREESLLIRLAQARRQVLSSISLQAVAAESCPA